MGIMNLNFLGNRINERKYEFATEDNFCLNFVLILYNAYDKAGLL
jgi:hypothetical protein